MEDADLGALIREAQVRAKELNEGRSNLNEVQKAIQALEHVIDSVFLTDEDRKLKEEEALSILRSTPHVGKMATEIVSARKRLREIEAALDEYPVVLIYKDE